MVECCPVSELTISYTEAPDQICFVTFTLTNPSLLEKNRNSLTVAVAFGMI